MENRLARLTTFGALIAVTQYALQQAVWSLPLSFYQFFQPDLAAYIKGGDKWAVHNVAAWGHAMDLQAANETFAFWFFILFWLVAVAISYRLSGKRLFESILVTQIGKTVAGICFAAHLGNSVTALLPNDLGFLGLGTLLWYVQAACLVRPAQRLDRAVQLARLQDPWPEVSGRQQKLLTASNAIVFFILSEDDGLEYCDGLETDLERKLRLDPERAVRGYFRNVLRDAPDLIRYKLQRQLRGGFLPSGGKQR